MPPRTPTAKSSRPSISTPPIRFGDDKAAVARAPPKGSQIRKKKASRSLFASLLDFSARVAVFYFAIGAVWYCSTSPFSFKYSSNDPRAVCRGIAQTKSHLVSHVEPHLAALQGKIEPHWRPVQPYVDRAVKTSRPVVKRLSKHSRKIYNKRVEPLRKKYVKATRSYVDPHVKKAQKAYSANVQPHLDTAQRTIKPYRDIYKKDVDPYVKTAYSTALASSSNAYTFFVAHIQPRIISTLRALHAFYLNHISPAIRRAYSLYVRPRMERLLERYFNIKVKGASKDAIAESKKEARVIAQKQEIAGEEKIKEAHDKAVKKEQDPSVADQLGKAAEAVFGGAKAPEVVNSEYTPEETDPIKIAELDAQLEAEEAKVSAQLAVWEEKLASLIQTEYALLTRHFAELRNRRMVDLPDRFAQLTDTFAEEQVSVILQRLERGFKKQSASTDPETLEQRIAAAEELVKQQEAKLSEKAAATSAEINQYYATLRSDEQASLDVSASAIDDFVEAAITDYKKLMREAKFAATLDDWNGWAQGLQVRAKMYREETGEVQSGVKKVKTAIEGTVDLSGEPQIGKYTDDLQKRLSALHQEALTEIRSFAKSGYASLRGEARRARVADITDAIAERAQHFANDAASSMQAAALSARSKLGLSEEVPRTGILASLQSQASRATEKVQSAVGVSSTESGYVYSATEAVRAQYEEVVEGVGSIAADASSVVHTATRSVISAAGGSPTPESVSDYVEDAKKLAEQAFETGKGYVERAAEAVEETFEDAKSAAGDYGASVSEALHQATRSALSAAGATPTAESASEYVEAAAAGAEEAYETAKGYVASAADAVRQAAADTLDGASGLAEDASSVVHSATRSIVSAAGGHPTPETAAEYVEDAQRRVVEVAEGAKGGILHGVEEAKKAYKHVADEL